MKKKAIMYIIVLSCAYCGPISTAGEAGESVMFTVVALVPEGVSL